MKEKIVPIDVIPLLSSVNECKDFDCGIKLIDDFLLGEAVESDRQFMTQTTTFWIENKVIGYYTAHASTLTLKPVDLKIFQDDGVEVKEREDEISHAITVPTVSLAYFGVDRSFQNRGIGTLLLHHFLLNIAQTYISGRLGVAGVVLQSLPDPVEFYQSFGFELLGGVDYENSPIRKTYDMFASMPKILDLVAAHLPPKPKSPK